MLNRWQNTGGSSVGGTTPAFQLPLQSSLVPVSSGGSATPTFTRATTAYQTDFAGKLNAVVSGEARFQGARRVRNLVNASSEAFGGAGWTTFFGSATVTTGKTDPLGGTTAAEVAFSGNTQWGNTPLYYAGMVGCGSMWLRCLSGTQAINLFVFDTTGGTQTQALTLSTTWVRYTLTKTLGSNIAPRFGLSSASGTFSVQLAFAQIEDVTGQSNQNPSEYVSVGVLSAPYHGAGVDGVKYFTTLNGNTVASNVVTEATGAVIVTGASGVAATAPVNAGGPFGYLAEGAATQILSTADIRDMTTASWTLGATMTRARTSVGADGAANSATRLTGGAVAATNTCYTTVVAAASSRTYSAMVKRITGTGPVRVVQTGTETDISAQLNTSTYVLVQLNASILNAVMGIKIDTNGDAIDVDFNQFESKAFATSRMAATGAARNADVLTYPSAGNVSGTVGSAYVEMTAAAYSGVSQGILADAVANRQIMTFQGTSTGRQTYDGVNFNAYTSPALALNTIGKMAVSWSGIVLPWYEAGALSGTGVFDGDFNIGTNLKVGDVFYGTIRNVRLYNLALSAAQLKAMTT